MKSKSGSVVLALAIFAVSAFAVSEILSFEEFRKVALEVSDGTQSGEECQLKVQENSGGLVLSMRNGEKTASFFVAKNSKVRKTGKSTSDGSYSYNYKVTGQGVLSVVHMDDAYFHVTLKSLRNNQTTHCDIDF